MRTRFGLLGGVLVLVLGAGIAALAYQAGVSQGAATAASAGSVVVVGGGPWGFGIFGVLFGLFFLFILARIVIGVTFGAFGRGRGPWGHGGFTGRRAWMDSSAGGPDAGGPVRADRAATGVTARRSSRRCTGTCTSAMRPPGPYPRPIQAHPQREHRPAPDRARRVAVA